MIQLPKISIVVAVYNGAATLAKCIESVKQQKYLQKELIIIDGGSNDSTVDILQAYNKDISYWESTKDRGIYHALNKGVAKAGGDWIVILGSDDYLWTDDVLEEAGQKLIQVSSQYLIVYGRVAMVNRGYRVIAMHGEAWNSKIKKVFFTEKNVFPHQGVFHHKNLFQQYGNFSEDYKCAGDYEFFLRVLAKNNRQALFFDDLIVSGMRNDGFSNQRKHAVEIFFEEIQARKSALGHELPKCKFLYKLIRVWVKQLLARSFGELFVVYIIIFYDKIFVR